MSAADGSESSAPNPEGRPLPSLHPIFASSRGKGSGGRGRARGRGEAPDDPPPTGPRLVGLSLAALETAVRGSGDDQESTIFSEDEEEEQPSKKSRTEQNSAPRPPQPWRQWPPRRSLVRTPAVRPARRWKRLRPVPPRRQDSTGRSPQTGGSSLSGASPVSAARSTRSSWARWMSL